MKIFISTILIVMSNCLAYELPEKFFSVFPEPDSKMVSPQVTIIIKCKDFINEPDIHFRITGSKSGFSGGEVIFAEGGSTILFKPYLPFSPGERIDVKITGIVHYSFSFDIAARPDNDYDFQRYLKTNENLSVVSKSTMQKNTGQTFTINGVTVPADFPQVQVDQYGQTAPGKIFFGSTFGSLGNYIVILENDGTPYFYRRYPSFTNGSGEFKLQPAGILTFFLYEPRHFIGLNHEYNEIDTLTCKHGYITDAHELLVLANGHKFFIALDPQKVDMSVIVPGGNENATVLGNHVQELDENDNVVFEWRSWDHFNIVDAEHVNLLASNIDYVHMNSIAIDYDGHIIISSRHLSEVTKINHQTGEMIWRLGGVHNQFEFIDEPYEISAQHHARPVPGKPDHYTIFDNGNHRQPQFSRAVEYKINTDSMTAQKVWEFRYEPDHYSSMMGSSQRLKNDNTFINWADWPPLLACEVNSENEIVFELRAENVSSNRIRRFEWEGISPVPYLIAESYSSGVVLIFNKFGDPDVDYYKIYGASSPNPTTVLDSTESTAIELTELENEQFYYFRVTSVNYSGVESDFSNEEKIFVSLIPRYENMVLNGDFSDGINPWVWEVRDASANWNIMDEVFHFSIAEGGINIYDVQLKQNTIRLVEGRTYIFEFDAYTDGARTIEAKVGQDNDPWINYSGIGYSYLTETNRHFSYTFDMNEPTDLNARVVFNTGIASDDVYIDNVSIKEVYQSGLNENQDTGSRDFQYKLNRNYPNPFNYSTIISFSLPCDDRVELSVYNICGQRIKTVLRESRIAGFHQIIFDASDLPSGIYFYRLKTASFSQMHKMILLK